MDKLLWKRIIRDSGYHKVCIPYMVGKYYEQGIITNIDSSQCIKEVLNDIIESACVGREVAIFPCTSYTPNILMIQPLREGRSLDDINSIIENHAYCLNGQGEKVLFLPLNGYTGQQELETLSNKLWDEYGTPIKQKTFSVGHALTEQQDGTYNIWSKF